jgi:hypothetical protein
VHDAVAVVKNEPDPVTALDFAFIYLELDDRVGTVVAGRTHVELARNAHVMVKPLLSGLTARTVTS